MTLLTCLFSRSYAGIYTTIIQRKGEGMPTTDHSIRGPSPPGAVSGRGPIRQPNTSAQYALGSWREYER